MFSAALFEGSGFRGLRRVIDVSGDGTNNQGPLVTLVRDDVPIHGRVLDTQGRPVAGVTVRLGRVSAVKEGVDLDAMLASGNVDDAHVSASYGRDDVAWPGGQNTWTSDVDGRFVGLPVIDEERAVDPDADRVVADGLNGVLASRQVDAAGRLQRPPLLRYSVDRRTIPDEIQARDPPLDERRAALQQCGEVVSVLARIRGLVPGEHALRPCDSWLEVTIRGVHPWRALPAAVSDRNLPVA